MPTARRPSPACRSPAGVNRSSSPRPASRSRSACCSCSPSPRSSATASSSRRARSAEVARLRSAALTDNLTGLQQPPGVPGGSGAPAGADDGPAVSLVLLDLDGLKQANDLHGHQVGDECIVALGAAISGRGRRRRAYRVGGDEFALICSTTAAPIDALNMVQRLQATLGRTPSGLAGRRHRRRRRGRAQAAIATGLMRRADLALIQAKRTHRGALIYTPDLEPILHVAERGRGVAPPGDAGDRARARGGRQGRLHAQPLRDRRRAVRDDRPASWAWTRPTLARLRLAGLLHDVGKIGITDAHPPEAGAADRARSTR